MLIVFGNSMVKPESDFGCAVLNHAPIKTCVTSNIYIYIYIYIYINVDY
jgi:hypothetical protein